jgi:hypothetical protein
MRSYLPLVRLGLALGLLGMLGHGSASQANPTHSHSTHVTCTACGGTGRCQLDWPVGSGRTYEGNAEYICSGTGRCYTCSGKGSF